jgi:hypothetical protein
MSPIKSDRVFGPRAVETTSVAVVTALVAVLAWHQTDLTGVRALTNTTIAALVTAVSMTLVYTLIRALDPHWYRP